MERDYIKYDPKKNLPTHEHIIPNQRYKDIKALESAVYVTNETTQNLTPSQKELLESHFRLVILEFQHSQ